jgi:hypothetical protein
MDDLPIYDQDHDQDPTEPVVRFKGLIRSASGVVIARGSDGDEEIARAG